jgi:hypothetical protein
MALQAEAENGMQNPNIRSALGEKLRRPRIRGKAGRRSRKDPASGRRLPKVPPAACAAFWSTTSRHRHPSICGSNFGRLECQRYGYSWIILSGACAAPPLQGGTPRAGNNNRTWIRSFNQELVLSVYQPPDRLCFSALN